MKLEILIGSFKIIQKCNKKKIEKFTIIFVNKIKREKTKDNKTNKNLNFFLNLIYFSILKMFRTEYLFININSIFNYRKLVSKSLWVCAHKILIK